MVQLCFLKKKLIVRDAAIVEKVRVDRKKYKLLSRIDRSADFSYFDYLRCVAQTVAGQLQMTGTCTGRSFTTAVN